MRNATGRRRSLLSWEQQTALAQRLLPVFWLHPDDAYRPEGFETYFEHCELWFHAEGMPPELVLQRGQVTAAALRKTRSSTGAPASCGMAADGRLVRLDVAVSDRPGGIAELTKELADLGASVKDIFHERAWLFSSVDQVRVKVVLETLGSGALPAVERLSLAVNKIGDEGLRHLGDALARGAAPALETLGLFGNPASDAAQQAVRDARPGLEIV